MFDLKEIQDGIDKSHEKLLKAIQNKIKEMQSDFNEIYSELQIKDDNYYEIHAKEKNEFK